MGERLIIPDKLDAPHRWQLIRRWRTGRADAAFLSDLHEAMSKPLCVHIVQAADRLPSPIYRPPKCEVCDE